MNIEINSINDRLDSFLNLPRRWDGYDGVPINKMAVLKAKEIASLLPCYNWQAVPCSSSAVQLEYHGDGFSIEIYIEAV